MSESINVIAGRNRVQHLLLVWFAENQRDLPWRVDYVPYHVWIAEIMGQQTQMDRVVQYFNRWISRFPDIASVAEASEQHILKYWEGLGYYSRAKNIHKTAKLLVQDHAAEIPADRQLLLALPGIGPYTAAAILSIAFNKPYPLLDANVERLFARLLDIDQPVKQAAVQAKFHGLAKLLLPEGKERMFNQALMEFGALVCRPKNPDCSNCPLTDNCLACQHHTADKRPVVRKKEKKVEIIMACGIIVHNGLYYIQQRLADDVWGSLWEFPGGRLKQGETPEQAARREIREETEFAVQQLRPFATVVHHYTKYRVTLHSFICSLPDAQLEPVLHAAVQYCWVDCLSLRDFPYPAGHRKLVERLGQQAPSVTSTLL